jgi:dienelactone hydrolase
MRSILCAVVACALGQAASAAMKTEQIEYKQGDTALQGYIAYDDASEGKRPGVIVVHEWWGHNQHARNQAERLAKLGYVGFAIDMYGKGKLATHPTDAREMATAVRSNPQLATDRFMAAYNYITKHPKVDAERIGATGYCFGGSIILAMARRGVDIDALATFHSALTPIEPSTGKPIKTKILICHGGDDAFIPQADIDAFKKEMADAKADYEFLVLAGAKHSFTNPDADKAGVDGLAYNADADTKSWEAMTALFKKVFGK